MIGHDFAEGLRVQGRVLLALMLREARTRYGRTKFGYLWALFEPVIHISAFSLLYSSRIVAIPLGNSIVLFLATGFATFMGFRNVMGRTGGGYGSNEALLSFPIVRVMDVFLGRALLELATWLLVTLLILGSLILVGVAPLPFNVLKMLAAILALFAIGFGAGIVIGIVAEFWASMGTFMSVFSRLLYFSSAIFFLPDRTPPTFRNILGWNPVMHGITLFREGYYEGYESHLLDVRYLSLWAIGCVVAGLLTEKIARKPLRNLAT
jgi:capsular polysaccharide transport system permease protein